MRWHSGGTSNSDIGCYLWAGKSRPAEVTANNADDVLCRMNAFTSRTYVSTGRDGQGFSDAYRRACERIAADPETPKYAAIDIIMWLTLTDPNISALKPVTLMIHILDDNSQISNCWKCLTIFAQTGLMHGYPKVALEEFQKAANVVKRDTGSVPTWLADKLDFAAAEAAKQNH